MPGIPGKSANSSQYHLSPLLQVLLDALWVYTPSHIAVPERKMADAPLDHHQKSDPPADEPRLESWGEIASYLRREIRTVQRWEKYQGLPVRRLQIGKLGSVYAFRSELDKWFRERQPAPENSEEEVEKGTNGEIAAQVTVSTEREEEKSHRQR